MVDIKSLTLIDKETNNVLTKIFKSKSYINLLTDLKRSLYQHKSIHLIGCNDYGRLAIMIEASYRKFWLNLINYLPDRKDEFLANYDATKSLAIGGDLTIVNNAIDFKDLYMIGNRQVESDVNDGDICIVYGADGTSRAINQAAISASKIGASVYYLYDLLKEDLANVDVAKGICASKSIIRISLVNDKKIKCNCLKELIFTYSLLEQVSANWLKENLIDNEYKVIIDKSYISLSPNDYAKALGLFIKASSKDKTLASINNFNKLFEEKLAITNHEYLATILVALQNKGNNLLIDKRFENDNESKYRIFDCLYPSIVAWQHIFRRNINGLNESKNVYKSLGINNPKLSTYHSSELAEYMIGYEFDNNKKMDKLVLIDINEEYENGELNYYLKNCSSYNEAQIVRIGNVSRNKVGNNELAISLKLPKTCLDFYSHLVIYLLFNL